MPYAISNNPDSIKSQEQRGQRIELINDIRNLQIDFQVGIIVALKILALNIEQFCYSNLVELVVSKVQHL